MIVALRELADGVQRAACSVQRAACSVRRVAGELGYESVNAIITMFRKVLGSTPAQYFAQRRA